MKKIVFIALAVTFFVACEDGNIAPEKKLRTDCTIPATVVNLNGLDGCGFVFRLDNGDILVSYSYISCSAEGTMSIVNPLSDFEFVDGKKVLIEYELIQAASACQAGQLAKFTCISDAPTGSEE